MKKIFLGLSAIVLIVSVVLIGCKKEEIITDSPTNVAVKKKREKSVGGNLSCTFQAGHPFDLCSGQGACYVFYWPGNITHIHIPCQGKGKECTWTIGIGSAYVPDSPAYEQNIEFQIIGYTGQEFIIYDRSIEVPGSNLYLNIPAQLLRRNNSGNFVANTVSFTNNQVYPNL